MNKMAYIVYRNGISSVDAGFEPRSGQTKYHENGICGFSAKHAAEMTLHLLICITKMAASPLSVFFILSI